MTENKDNKNTLAVDVPTIPSISIEEEPVQGFPDGGYGWVVVLGSYLAHLVLGGFMRSGGVIFLELQEKFHEPAAETAWVISLAVTVRMLFGPLSSALSNRFSCRTVVMVGGIFLSAGVLMSGFTPNLAFMYFSYSVVGGIGRAFIYTPAVVIVALYFDKRRGTAAGLSNAGIGSGTFFIPPLMEMLFSQFGFTDAFFIMAAFGLHVCVFGALFRPLSIHRKISQNQRGRKADRVSSYDNKNRSKEVDECSTTLITHVRVKDFQNKPFTLQSRKASISQPELCSRRDHLNLGLRDWGSSQILSGPDTDVITFSQSVDGATNSFMTYKGSMLFPNHTCIGTSKNKITSTSINKIGGQESNSEQHKPENPRPKLLDWSLLLDVQFCTFCVGIGLFTLSFQASYVFIPPLAVQKGLSDVEAAYIVSIAGGFETFGSIISGVILDLRLVRPHRLSIYNVVMFILGILTLIIPFLRSFALFSCVCGVFGFLLGSCLGQKSTIVADILGTGNLVSSFGILVLFQGFGVFIGPPLSGILKDYYGVYDQGFYFGAAAMIVSGLIQGTGAVFVSYRNSKNKTQSP